jgi:hypothetical protein
VLAFHGPHAFALGTAMAIGAVDGGNGLPEQIGRRITAPLLGTQLLFPQLGTLSAKCLIKKGLGQKKPVIVGHSDQEDRELNSRRS